MGDERLVSTLLFQYQFISEMNRAQLGILANATGMSIALAYSNKLHQEIYAKAAVISLSKRQSAFKWRLRSHTLNISEVDLEDVDQMMARLRLTLPQISFRWSESFVHPDLLQLRHKA